MPKIKKSLKEWCEENNRMDLLEEWDYDKNNILGITPQTVVYGSNIKVHWKCKKGHEWQAPIYNRIINGYNCKKCSFWKRVRCVETGEVFESGTLAAKYYGLQPSNVLRCCKGKYHTCGDYHWEYVDEISESEEDNK